jgi:formate dehydrogenase subunit gamma
MAHKPVDHAMSTPQTHLTNDPRADGDFAFEVAQIIADHDGLEGPLLPILHAVQARFGHVPAAAHAPIANALNITRAELHGVLSFYHDFRDRPAGRHVLRICRAEACQAMGGAALADRVRDLLGVDWHGTTADGRVTLEPVYCLGLCACAPAAMLDGQVMGRVDPARLDAALGAET